MMIREIFRWFVGVGFVGSGLLHFVNPVVYLPLMPLWLPFHLELIYLSGFLEMVGGAGILINRFRPLAAVGLALLLVVIFPANLHVALNGWAEMDVPNWILWVRLPLQPLLMIWVLWIGTPAGGWRNWRGAPCADE